MEDVIFKIKVVEAAKAHVGKVLDVVVKQRGSLHYHEGRKLAQLYGDVTYNGNDYAVKIYETPEGLDMDLDAWPVRSKLHFSKIEIL